MVYHSELASIQSFTHLIIQSLFKPLTLRTTDYEDQVLTKLQELSPGSRVNLNALQYPERFKEAVIYLMDGDWLDMNQYVFNSDYTVLKKHEKFDIEKYRKQRRTAVRLDVDNSKTNKL